jgi:outer membrane protein assembly factor BamB
MIALSNIHSPIHRSMTPPVFHRLPRRSFFILPFAVAMALVMALPGVSVQAENWGHWRGVGGNGVSLTAKPPTEWSATKNVKWKVPVPGRGSGSPVVWGEQVFVVSAVGNPRSELEFKLLCFDRNTGALRWDRTAVTATPHEGTHQTNGFASGSPCTDGEHVYVHFGSRGLHCYTMEGELKWSRDLGKMTMRNGFGEGSSPTLAGDKIIVPWDHEGQSAIYALDKHSGETIWKTDRDEPSCWATPLVVESGGRKQVITNGENQARAYDLETGKELWRCGGQTQRPVASPVFANDVVYIGSGFRGSFLGAFQLDGSGDIAGSDKVIWSVSEDTPDIASPLLSNGRLYYYKGKTGILTCADAASGKILFGPERIPGVASTYASPIAAAGHVYLTGRSGNITVIKDADTLQVVATNSVGETVDATPVPVDRQLFIRGENHLFCISE